MQSQVKWKVRCKGLKSLNSEQSWNLKHTRSFYIIVYILLQYPILYISSIVQLHSSTCRWRQTTSSEINKHKCFALVCQYLLMSHLCVEWILRKDLLLVCFFFKTFVRFDNINPWWKCNPHISAFEIQPQKPFLTLRVRAPTGNMTL